MMVSANRGKPRAGLIVDASKSIGLGHVPRMVAVALAFADADWTPVFLSSTDRDVYQWMERHGFKQFEVLPLHDPQEAGEAHAFDLDVAIMDTPLIEDPSVIESLRNHCLTVAVQLKNRVGLAADILVLPDAHNSRFRGVAERHRESTGLPAKILSGWEYVLVSPLAAALGGHRQAHDSIVISTGGRVEWSEVGPLAMSFRACVADEAPVIVLGGTFWAGMDAEELPDGIELRPFDPRVLAEAGLAVVTMGVTAYECVYWQTPVMTVSRDSRSEDMARALEATGASHHLGRLGSISLPMVREALEGSLDQEPQVQRRLTSRIDGLGPARLVDEIQERLGPRVLPVE